MCNPGVVYGAMAPRQWSALWVGGALSPWRVQASAILVFRGGFMHAPTASLGAWGVFGSVPCQKITVLYDVFLTVLVSMRSVRVDLRKRMHKIGLEVTSGAYSF